MNARRKINKNCHHLGDLSSPLSKQRHNSRTKGHCANSAKNLFDRRPLHVPAEHELVRHELHKTSIDQNTSRDRIENAVDNQRRLGSRRERLPHAKADSNGDGRGDRVAGRQPVGSPALGLGPFDRCQSRAEREAFEGLVEDEHDVEGGEFFAGDGEGEADED
jgi:hypothetical protein